MKLIRKTNLGNCNVPVYDLTVLDNSNYQITENDIIVHNSGKSFTAADIFGVDKKFKTSFAASGLKVVNSDPAFEKMLKDNGINPKELGNIEKNDPELWDRIVGKDSIRSRAKNLSNKQRAFYEEGRLGMIVDGTGDDYEKIKKQKQHAESLGYDCYMVFVNTTLEVALERNRKRERTLPDSLVEDIWKDVQSNLGKFQGLFGNNFSIVDNTIYGPSPTLVVKAINKFLRQPIVNRIGKKWIETARLLKSKKVIESNRILEKDYKKNKYYDVTSSTEIDQLAQNLFDLVNNSYSKIGGHPDVKSPSDITSPDIDHWLVADTDNDPEIDVTAFSKKRAGGNKFSGLGHDGDRSNIKNLLTKLTSMLKTKGNYMEVSGDAFRTFVINGNVPTVDDENVVRKILKGKSITWHGKHPTNKDLPGNGWYSRNIEGLGQSLKTMIGNPSY